MEQMTAAYNNEPLCSVSWQTRLIRVRTWNNVFLKPEIILCKVSGTKSSYILCSEMWTHLLLSAFAMYSPSSPKQTTVQVDLLTSGEKLWISQRRGKDASVSKQTKFTLKASAFSFTNSSGMIPVTSGQKFAWFIMLGFSNVSCFLHKISRRGDSHLKFAHFVATLQGRRCNKQ